MIDEKDNDNITTTDESGETTPSPEPTTPELPTPEQTPQSGGESGAAGGEKKHRNLYQRLLTALFIAVLYVVPILLGLMVHPLFYDALIVFLMLAASYEVCRALAAKYSRPIEGFVYVNVVLGYAVFKIVDTYFGNGSGGITSFFGVLAVTFIACIVYNMASKNHSISNVISTLFAMIYPGAIMTYLLSLNYLGSNAAVAIVMAFGATTLTDSMAYFVGTTVRGPKLCPKISPKKTISGAIGGLIGGVGAGLIIYFLARGNFLTLQPIMTASVPNLLHFLFLGLGTSLFCQIGDLISSYIKRSCGIKDYGKILRGHGGFMDRIDGLIISAVFIFIYFTVLGVVL